MKKTLFATILFVCGVFKGMAQHAVQPYFNVWQLPNLIKCLPPPPSFDSPEFAYDVVRYQWGKIQRLDSVRAAIAQRDAPWSYGTLFAEFDEPFGLHISKEETPEIWKLLVTSLVTTDQMRVAPKAHYHRTRPFVMYNEHLLTTKFEDDIRHEGSYPSGHTARGWTCALLLAEIAPANSDTIFARGWMYGESRVIEGAHWQSDVDASRVAASIGYCALQNSAAFREQMAKAKAEYAEKKGTQGTVATNDASQFVTLTDAVPDAILEIRYFGTYNFVGERIDGYLEPTALLTRKAAEALKAVSDDVMAQGYRLKIYDAYRPQQGVDHFVRWSKNIPDIRMKKYFYPDLDKSVLFDQEYIMEKSGHTRGSTVDLTLFDMSTEKEVDMGGTFDWFGPESHPDFCGNPDTGQYTGNNSKSPTGRSITAEQFRNRMILRQAMLRHGFKPLDSEWWHFTLKDEPFPDTYFTFPVKQLHR